MIDRITVLGGSSVYTPEFLEALLSHHVLVKELVLLGKPGQKLDIVSRFCQRLVKRSGHLTEIVPETDPEKAMAGASYIINQVRVGGMKSRIRDEKLPPQFDMVGSERLGAGAITNALRTLPVVFNLAQCAEAVNPKVKIINLSNPVGILVEALNRYTPLNVVGVSDLPGIYVEKIAALLGRKSESLEINYLGLYDLGWIQDVKVAGISRMSQLLEQVEKSEDELFDHALIHMFRMIPVRVLGVYYRRHEVLRRQQTGARFRGEALYDAEQRILKMYARPSLNKVPDLTRQRNALWYDNTIIPLLKQFESGTEAATILCVPNKGAILDLPEHSTVEVPVTITPKGIKARKMGMLPRFISGLYHAIKESDRLVIEAVRHKSRDLALQSLVVNPFVSSIGQATEYLDKVIRQEKLDLF
jgi:6-phospho-beta-glucosidase